ncbi:MAG: invasion associated locus B family protein [Pseudomonadota bacterium]
MRTLILSCFTAAAMMVVASAAQAQAPALLEAFKDWAAYSVDGPNGKVCYVASQPKDQQPTGVNRDPVFFMVSHWQGRDVKNEASIIIGYPFAENSKVTADVDGTTFTMFTKGDGAWMENVSEENRLVQAMKAGSRMVVKGTSRRGTNTTDTYSLSGITAAINRIDSACG